MKEPEKLKKSIFWVFTILFPILILGILELGLRIGGYNVENQEAFIEYKGDDDYMVFNHQFVTRYFPSFKPDIAPNPFLKQKQPNTFRLLVFGGSSAQGFPYNFYYSFANQLEQKLLLNTNGLHVEVINLGMTAVNSYVIRDLAKRVDEYEPDAVIIYAGHNEYYGSFGAGTTQFGLINNVPLKRLVLFLKDFRLFQLLENRMKPEMTGNKENRTLMSEVIRESDIQVDSDVFNAGIEQFERNISDVVYRFTNDQIPVFIGTLGSNLKDQAPLGNNDNALAAFEEGKALYAQGEIEAALEKFTQAKELDGIRFRAPEALNTFIRSLDAIEGVTIVEINQALRNASLSGIEDNSIFTDHLHPDAEGHMLMADVFLDSMKEHKAVQSAYAPNSFDIPPAISSFEKTYSTTVISRLVSGYPFEKGLTIQEELNAFNRIYEGYLKTSFVDSIAAKTARLNGIVPEALTEIVNTARDKGDSTMVITHYHELLKWQLNSISLIEKGIEYAVNNRKMDTYLVNMITQILNDGNYDPRYMDVLSSLYLLNSDLDKAGYWLSESEKIAPDSPRMLYNFGRYHILRKDTLAASQYYSRYLNATRENQ